MAKAPITIEPDAPKLDVLNASHMSHAVNAVNLLRGHQFAYGAGIDALTTERVGQIDAFNAAVADLTDKHNASIAEIDRRIADLQLASAMMEAGLQRHDPTPENKQ